MYSHHIFFSDRQLLPFSNMSVFFHFCSWIIYTSFFKASYNYSFTCIYVLFQAINNSLIWNISLVYYLVYRDDKSLFILFHYAFKLCQDGQVPISSRTVAVRKRALGLYSSHVQANYSIYNLPFLPRLDCSKVFTDFAELVES